MTLSKTIKIVISLGVIAAVTAAVVPAVVIPLRNNENKITFTLLDNAGVMIEHKGVRIYIDPINLDRSYIDLKADAILITHPHGDHYEAVSYNRIVKSDTLKLFPENMSQEISINLGTGVNPEDEFQVGHISITAFYMYTLPLGEYPASHPQEANWTSYIIDIDGFVFFHAGDSKNIQEYEDISGMVDVALLPLGPGCQTMVDMEVVDAAETLGAS
ncbi:MAG: MBL fold metallo-hydrolase, partial [Asgard group archaeon]|nr:MBL fold metallo-hydrolase [Asgard group archaeon]